MSLDFAANNIPIVPQVIRLTSTKAALVYEVEARSLQVKTGDQSGSIGLLSFKLAKGIAA
jgi:hypothetical protein